MAVEGRGEKGVSKSQDLDWGRLWELFQQRCQGELAVAASLEPARRGWLASGRRWSPPEARCRGTFSRGKQQLPDRDREGPWRGQLFYGVFVVIPLNLPVCPLLLFFIQSFLYPWMHRRCIRGECLSVKTNALSFSEGSERGAALSALGGAGTLPARAGVQLLVIPSIPTPFDSTRLHPEFQLLVLNPQQPLALT